MHESRGLGDVYKRQFLHCVSEYPARHPHIDRVRHLRSYFNNQALIGFSDHSYGHNVRHGQMAVAAGACILERHVSIHGMPSDDKEWSMSTLAFGYWCDCVRESYISMSAKPCEPDAPLRFRRSIYAVQDIAEGEPFTRDNVRVIRPGYGLHPRMLREVLDTHAKCPIVSGEPITIDNADLFGKQNKDAIGG